MNGNAKKIGEVMDHKDVQLRNIKNTIQKKVQEITEKQKADAK